MPTPTRTITGVVHDAYLDSEEDSVLLRVRTADSVLTRAHTTGNQTRTMWTAIRRTSIRSRWPGSGANRTTGLI